MKATLTLFYSRNVYLDLLKDIELEDIDKITTEYIGPQDLREKDDFRSEIKRFQVYYANYLKKINNPRDKDGKFVITYYNQNGVFSRLRVLYKEDVKKLNPSVVVRGITDCLRKAKDNRLLLMLFQTFDFILESEFNFRYHHLAMLKSDLSYSAFPNKNTISKYNKLVKIVYDELMKGYDKSTCTTSSISYYHIRLIDEFLEIDNGFSTTPKKSVTKLDIVPDNFCLLSDAKLKKEKKPSRKKESSKKVEYHGMGDYFLECEEERWKTYRK